MLSSQGELWTPWVFAVFLNILAAVASCAASHSQARLSLKAGQHIQAFIPS